jgi:hypothetical protein
MRRSQVLCRIIRRRLLTLIAGFSPALLLMVLTAGCSADHSALKRSPCSSAVIYAIPQSEALALVREATLAVETRYGVSDLAIVEYPPAFPHVYFIPIAGTAASGQKVTGFRFEVWPVARCVRPPCVRPFVDALQAALDATGTATTVTNFQVRPHGEGGGDR